MPRNIASVPSVASKDGRPSRVTRTPLKAPQIAPAMSVRMIAAGSGKPCWSNSPNMTLLSAKVLATDRSISRATMSSTIGSTISAFSDIPAIACEMLKAVAKPGTVKLTVAASTSAMLPKKVSQLVEAGQSLHRCVPAARRATNVSIVTAATMTKP